MRLCEILKVKDDNDAKRLFEGLDAIYDDLTGQVRTYKYDATLYGTATQIGDIDTSEEDALQSVTYNNLKKEGATVDREKGDGDRMLEPGHDSLLVDEPALTSSTACSP